MNRGVSRKVLIRKKKPGRELRPHLFGGHEWVEIDVFEFGRSHHVAVNESNFRYYKCSCGKVVRESSQKVMQVPHH